MKGPLQTDLGNLRLEAQDIRSSHIQIAGVSSRSEPIHPLFDLSSLAHVDSVSKAEVTGEELFVLVVDRVVVDRSRDRRDVLRTAHDGSGASEVGV